MAVDASKLVTLSTDALMVMEKEIAKILASRLDTRVQAGRIATFKDNNGNTRTCVINKVNQKTASVVETTDSVNPGGKWRVGLSQLKVNPVVRKVAVRSAEAPHKPSTPADSW